MPDAFDRLNAVDEEPEVEGLLRWACDSCGGNETNAPAGIIPEGWEVDDEDDLETCRAICSSCAADGETT